MVPSATLRGVLVSTEDLDATLSFYTDTLGFSLSFRDGDRYAALKAGDTNLALAVPDEHPSPGNTVLTLKVEHVQAAMKELEIKGAEVLAAPACGDHEVRALIRAPGGALLSIYGPKR